MERGEAEGRNRSGSSVLAVLTFGLVLAGYGVAFGYWAAQPRAASGDEVLAGWLAGPGAYDPWRHDVTFRIAGAPAARAGDVAGRRGAGELRAAGARVPG
jgi:hypothetical protein